MKCVQNLRVDFSTCPKECEGMDVISYDKEEIDSKLTKTLSKNGIQFNKNPKLKRHISKLSDEYNIYKEKYNFPKEYKGDFVSLNEL